MSGQQVGTVIGFVAGFFLPGGPMVWASIGGMVGGAISPTEVKGPHIGDGQNQSSAEGVPIAWVLGTAGYIQGNIVDKGPRREVKKEDDGKGSGTVAVTYEAHQDFTIMVCESSETRNSLMVGVLIVRCNGKIVYDMRPDSNMGADNAKFLRNHTFYDGNEAQLTDPTEEAWPQNGVGNTPYYRGVYRMVARDINLSQYGDAIPTYEFVMVGAGEASTTTIESLVVPAYSRFIDAHFPLADRQDRYTYSGNRGGEIFVADTIDEILDHFSDFYDVYRRPSYYLGYAKYPFGSEDSFDVIHPQPTVVNDERVVLIYTDLPVSSFADEDAPQFCTVIPYPGPFAVSENWCDRNGVVVFMESDDNDGSYGPYDFQNNCTLLPPTAPARYPQIWSSKPVIITVTRAAFVPEAVIGDPCLLGQPTILPDAPGFVQDCAGNVFPEPTYAPATGPDVLVLQNVGAGQIMLAPVMRPADPNNNETFWTAAYDAAVASGAMEAGKVYGVDYPVYTPSSGVFTANITTSEITTDPLSLATATTRICERGGLTALDINVTDMDQDVLGYPVRDTYDGAGTLRPLLFAYTMYGSEYDGVLHFHKHGADIEITIDPDDLIDDGEETDRTTREQEVEYPRKIGVGYIDPDQNYEARPQWAYRLSPDVRAKGEESMQAAVVMTADQAAQLADISIKVAWARAQGFREFALPYVQFDTYLQLVPGMPVGMDGKRWIVSELMMEDGQLGMKLVYDRQSAFTSNVTGVPGLPPTPPPSNIGGVTIAALMNAPVLRDQDDRLGIYVAIGGLLSGWPGCSIQVRIGETGEWTTPFPQATQASTIGYLTATLPLAPASGTDVTNTLSVNVNGPDLVSITDLQLLQERNPCAIVKADGTVEIIQFQNADETAPGAYDLTTLVRGGLNTTPAEHYQNARFVALNAPYFIELPSSAMGQEIFIRPVTFNTLPDNSAVYSIVWNPVVIQTEWEPAILDGRYTGSAFVASVIPRHRLGTDLNPIASANFSGYRWTLDDGNPAHARSFDTTEASAVFELADFDSPATITVAALNRITGPGPSKSITI